MANREILFRGKRTDDGKWVYGYYIKATHHWHSYGVHEDWIATDTVQNGGWCNVRGKYAVLPKTVGQYTGLTDKNGKKIFEGDIVAYPDGSCFGVVCSGDYESFDSYHTGFFVMWFEKGKLKGFRRDIRFWTMEQKAWVVGNIHDNPELLKGGAE